MLPGLPRSKLLLQPLIPQRLDVFPYCTGVSVLLPKAIEEIHHRIEERKWFFQNECIDCQNTK